jgi:murein DD-endopeptidase MepM/ murein hydrolase activator NlpD
MRIVVSRAFSLRHSANIFVTVAAAAMLAACSDSLERFSTAYSNPSDADPVYTAALPKSQRVIKSRPSYEASSDDLITAEPLTARPLERAPIWREPKPVQDYTQNYKKTYKQPKLVADESLEREPVYDEPQTAAAGKLRVEPGMTLYSIARANGLSVAELARANNIRKPYTVSSGRLLTLPGVASPIVPPNSLQAQRDEVTSAPDDDVAEVKSAPTKKAKPGSYVVQSGDTLYALGRKFGVSPLILADANGLSLKSHLSDGQKLKIPGAAGASLAAAKPARKLVLEPEEADVADTTDSEPAIGESDLREAATTQRPKIVEQIAEPVSPASQLAMRWPVRGKLISAFGKKPDGMKNEGINISVPEGTAVRAAETGVVAYAGNELKGYGNLVLIRHSGGYVTAYAHAKELLVKRGDTVKRGDVIAKAGATGSVTSPQLHFEVRKGATALNPANYLGSTTAMN